MLDTLNAPVIGWLDEFVSAGILITDSNLAIRGWNRWLEQRSGREKSGMIGRPLFDALPEIPERGLDGFYKDVLNGHAQVLANRFHQYLIVLPTDLETPLGRMLQTARIWPLMEDGRVSGTITSIEDVSERVVRESELSLAREHAEAANRAKDKLLATLSHDLRTPLSSILGWIRLMQRDPGDPKLLARAMKSIESNAILQVQLIDQILDTSRIAAGKLEFTVKNTDLAELANTAIDAILPLAHSKEIDIRREMPSEPALFPVDSKRIHQIIWNLLSNAVKFTPQGGTVRVSVRLAEAGVQLKVADSGMGIAAADLDRVFEPLWQSEQAGGYGGLGLGLSIAKQLAELHGGSLRAESGGPGQGATVTLELPRGGARNAGSGRI